MQPPCVMTVAGSDSGGGAGIQADLKTFMMQGCYGLSVITVLTAQNTRAVSAIEAPTPGFVAEQLRMVMADFPIRAAKTGMLFSAPIIEAVADELAKRDFPLVVDPVCVAQSGARLLLPEAVEALKTRILPLADVLTPNRHEAELLAGLSIATAEDGREAMERLLALGAKAVLLKGGHFEAVGDSDRAVLTDRLMTSDGQVRVFVRPLVATRNTHGTGCTLSAAIAARLAFGNPLPEAVEAARDYLQLALRAAYDLGGGDGPVHHLIPFVRQRDRLAALSSLERAGRVLATLGGLAEIVPEAGGDMVLALPFAASVADVAGLSGRLTKDYRGVVHVPDGAIFGASPDAALAILAVGARVADTRCMATVRCTEAILAVLQDAGILVVSFNGDEAGATGDAALGAGIGRALSGCPHPERVGAVRDCGATGREPLVRLLGRDADAVLGLLRLLCSRLGVPSPGLCNVGE